MVAPILDKIAKENAGKLLVAKVNTDENQEWAGKYGVQGIPTMLMLKDGKIVHRQVGALPEPMLKDVVKQFWKSAKLKTNWTYRAFRRLAIQLPASFLLNLA